MITIETKCEITDAKLTKANKNTFPYAKWSNPTWKATDMYSDKLFECKN